MALIFVPEPSVFGAGGVFALDAFFPPLPLVVCFLLAPLFGGPGPVLSAAAVAVDAFFDFFLDFFFVDFALFAVSTDA